jgi:IclR helix-turn-helix domain
MSPNYGSHGRPQEEIPDWLLGGNRKRRVLVALAGAPSAGWKVSELAKQLGCGPTTVYEILRVLRTLGVLEKRAGGGLALSEQGNVALALRGLLTALAPFDGCPVDRPPRRRGAT